MVRDRAWGLSDGRFVAARPPLAAARVWGYRDGLGFRV